MKCSRQSSANAQNNKKMPSRLAHERKIYSCRIHFHKENFIISTQVLLIVYLLSTTSLIRFRPQSSNSVAVCDQYSRDTIRVESEMHQCLSTYKIGQCLLS